MSRGNLFIISGPSGTGKGTICSELAKDEGIYLSISATTRDRRADEKDGVTYFYETKEGFMARIEKGLMLEWAKYGENYYGTPKDIVEKKLSEGINVILEIDVQGAFKVREKIPSAVMIFILPPSIDELKNRLVGRGREDEHEIERRIMAAKAELEKAFLYPHIIINSDLLKSVDEVRRIIAKTAENNKFLEKLIDEIEKKYNLGDCKINKSKG